LNIENSISGVQKPASLPVHPEKAPRSARDEPISPIILHPNCEYPVDNLLMLHEDYQDEVVDWGDDTRSSGSAPDSAATAFESFPIHLPWQSSDPLIMDASPFYGV
jgi:hypothetical protein